MAEDTRSCREFFTEAMEIWRRATTPSEYAPIWILLDQAAQYEDEAVTVGEYFLKKGDVPHRALGADMLGRVVAAHPHQRQRVTKALRVRLASEHDYDVCWSIATAIGITDDSACLEGLLPWVRVGELRVRNRALQVITHLQRHGRHTDEGVAAILESLDDDSPVIRRTAATAFAGVLKADAPSIRDALARLLFDGDDVIHREAIVALALRRDERAYSAIIGALRAPRVHRRTFDAVAALGDPSLLPLVERADHSDVTARDLRHVRSACGAYFV